MSDLISRQDVLHELEGCDYELKDWQRWKLKTMVRDIPSAEKAQLSGEDATKDATSGLIRKQDAIDALGKEPKFKIKMIKTYVEGRSDQWFKDVASIASLPSVEPTIIRCRDCKWKQGSECVRFAEVRPFPDDFCSRAERRGEEE